MFINVNDDNTDFAVYGLTKNPEKSAYFENELWFFCLNKNIHSTCLQDLWNKFQHPLERKEITNGTFHYEKLINTQPLVCISDIFDLASESLNPGLHKLYVTCMQTALHMHENLCTILIPLCKNNLDLPMFFFFFFFCPMFGCLHHVVVLATSLRCADFFVCLLLQKPKVGFHSSYFADEKNIT